MGSQQPVLTPAEKEVYRAFWCAVRDGRSCGGDALGQEIDHSPRNTHRLLRNLRDKGAIPSRSPGQRGVPSEWRTMLPSEFVEYTPVVPTTLMNILQDKPGEPLSIVELADALDISPRRVCEEAAQLEHVNVVDQGIQYDPPEEEKLFPEVIRGEDVGYPERSLEEQLADLRQENDELRRMMEYTTHSDTPPQGLQSGLFTLNSSDHHYHNKGHLIRAIRSLEGKVLDLLDRFQPQRFQGIINGDVVQGRGIYKNQFLDNILSKTEEQIVAAVYRFWEWDQQIAQKVPQREWFATQGNHDYSKGETTMVPFVWACRQFDIPISFVGQRYVLDLAESEGYNVLIKHGYGNSQYNSSPNKLIHEVLKEVVALQNRGFSGDKRIRRVLHGHVHWRNIGTEYAEELVFDVTGGLHRNDRANIGMNQRPTGWIAYISPPEAHNILTPIEITPSTKALHADQDDPELEERNREDAARCVQAYAEKAREMGLMRDLRLEMPDG